MNKRFLCVGASLYAALALVACSRAGDSINGGALPAAAHRVASEATSLPNAGWTYVTDSLKNVVHVYDHSKEVGTITDANAPDALAVSPDGILAVHSNKGPRRPSEILLYKPGETKSYAKITDGVDNGDPMLFDRNGELYVSEPDRVNVYKLGQDSPVKTYDGIEDRAAAMALNSTGTLATAGSGHVYLFPPDSTKPAATIDIAGETTRVPGLSFDRNDYLAVSEWAKGDVEIYKYKPGSDPALFATITDGLHHPSVLAVDSHDDLYVADQSSGKSDVKVYGESDSSPIRTLTKNLENDFLRKIAFDEQDDVYVLSYRQVAEFEAGGDGLLRSLPGGDDIAIAP